MHKCNSELRQPASKQTLQFCGYNQFSSSHKNGTDEKMGVVSFGIFTVNSDFFTYPWGHIIQQQFSTQTLVSSSSIIFKERFNVIIIVKLNVTFIRFNIIRTCIPSLLYFGMCI